MLICSKKTPYKARKIHPHPPSIIFIVLFFRTIMRNVYNYTVNADKMQAPTLESYLTEYKARNESLSSGYSSYIVPGSENSKKVEIDINL